MLDKMMEGQPMKLLTMNFSALEAQDGYKLTGSHLLENTNAEALVAKMVCTPHHFKPAGGKAQGGMR